MAVLQAASIVRTSLESITGEEAGRWTLMMKNMGNWSRLEKGNGMGPGFSAVADITVDEDAGHKKQDSGFK